MSAEDSPTRDLLLRADRSDQSAVEQLLQQSRPRLKRMIAIYLEDELRSRVDPSDVVQEALAVAAGRLPDYLRSRQVPFYAWLRSLACEQLVQTRRRHIGAKKRSVYSEAGGGLVLPDRSTSQLVDRLISSGTSPSVQLAKQEMRRRVRLALARMLPDDRELLVLKYLEQVSTNEIAAVMGLTPKAVRSRHGRALERLRRLLETVSE